jgi:putative phage-type endonuclease
MVAMPAEKLTGYSVADIGHHPIILADLRETEHSYWLKLRESYLGASEVATALGLNPYKSPLRLYLDKMGQAEDLSDNEHVEFGIQMEAPIRKWFGKRFATAEGVEVKVQEYPYTLRHPDIEFLSASPDGLIEHPGHGIGLIEIKTASERMWRDWEGDNLPDMYYLQIQTQLCVTGLNYAYIVALVGKKLLWKYIPRNDEVITAMVEQASKFWYDHVLAKVPPAPVGLSSDTDALKLLYPEPTGDVVQLHHLQEDYDRYKELKKQEKELGLETEAIKQRFMAEMGTAETALVGKKKATWRWQEGSTYTVERKPGRTFRIY